MMKLHSIGPRNHVQVPGFTYQRSIVKLIRRVASTCCATHCPFEPLLFSFKFTFKFAFFGGDPKEFLFTKFECK